MKLAKAFLLLSAAATATADHCSSPGSLMGEVCAPSDGSTTTQQGALASEATDTYSMMAYSGCTYKFSFCPEDGGSSDSSSGLQSNSPWARIWDINTSFSPSGCPNFTTCSIGGDIVGVTQWTPTTTGMVRIGVDTWFGGALSGYTLAVSASGTTCRDSCCFESVDITSPTQDLTSSGQQLDFVFPNLQEAVGDVQVQVNTRGDINSPNITPNDSDEFYVVTAEGSVPLGNTGNNPQCSLTYRTDTFTILQADFNNYISGDGELTIEADALPGVDDFCAEDDAFVKLVYTSVCSSTSPSSSPTGSPSKSPSKAPSLSPSSSPTGSPSKSPSSSPSSSPTKEPTKAPSLSPSKSPSSSPSKSPSASPSSSPTKADIDKDGVFDDVDECIGTSIDEDVPENELNPNHFVLGPDGTFVKGEPKGKGKGTDKSFTIEDTRGCSCEQIIEKLGLGKGHRQFGCSPGVMDCWANKNCDDYLFDRNLRGNLE